MSGWGAQVMGVGGCGMGRRCPEAGRMRQRPQVVTGRVGGLRGDRGPPDDGGGGGGGGWGLGGGSQVMGDPDDGGGGGGGRGGGDGGGGGG